MDPIAVDVPAKPAFARSVPGPIPAPAVPTLPNPAPLPAPRVDLPKPTPAAVAPAPAPKPAAAPAPVPAPTPPPVPTAAPAPEPLIPTPAATAAGTTTASGLLARFTKRQLKIGGAAALSLAVGIGAVRVLFPSADDSKFLSGADLSAATASHTGSTPAPSAPPKLTVDTPVVTLGPDGMPVIPVAAFPTTPVSPAPPSSAKPRDITPISGSLPPPAIVPDVPPAYLPIVPPAANKNDPPKDPYAGYQPYSPPTPGGKNPAPPPAAPIAPPPAFELPAVPPVPSVFPAGGTDPKPGGTPPLPAVPSVPPAGVPVIPPAPGMTPVVPPTVIPAPDMKPVIPAPDLKPGLPAPDFKPVVPPSTPKQPDKPGIDPIVPVIPPMPGGTSNPMVPVTPGGSDKPPSVLPIDMNPKPVIEVPGVPTGFAKPGGGTDAKPVVPESLPRTGFDVDLYDPRANDSYESISQEYYNDKRFAAALRAFNDYQPLQGGRYVNVPPIHILKKRFPTQVGAIPTGPASAPSTGGPDWGAAPKPEPLPARAASRGTYIVPPGGLTMEQVARQLGVKWSEIYDLNPQYSTGVPLAGGTELKVPPSARLP